MTEGVSLVRTHTHTQLDVRFTDGRCAHKGVLRRSSCFRVGRLVVLGLSCSLTKHKQPLWPLE